MNSKKMVLIFLYLATLSNARANPITFEQDDVQITRTDLSGYTHKYFITQPFNLTIDDFVKKGLRPIKVTIKNNSDKTVFIECIQENKSVNIPGVLACDNFSGRGELINFSDPYLYGGCIALLGAGALLIYILDRINTSIEIIAGAWYVAMGIGGAEIFRFNKLPALTELQKQLNKKLYSEEHIDPGTELETFILIQDANYHLNQWSINVLQATKKDTL